MSATPLLTRSAFFNQLKDAVSFYHQEKREFAVIIVGINRFRKINALFGFEIGDQILDKVAEKITGILPEGNYISKIANSEFAILFNNLNHIGQVILATNKILSLLGEPFSFEKDTLRIKATIGICGAHPKYPRVDDYIHHAETALLLAKNSNADYLIYSDEIEFNLI
jgi:diguanylate cyclase (GGDEF)-like protein